MQVFKTDYLSNIKQIVQRHAKYQKVMLIYDECAKSDEIFQVYEQIKNDCIFNKMDVNNFMPEEINDGYKMLIFLCKAKNFAKLSINLNEFTSVFVAQDSSVMPFFIEGNRLSQTNNYLFISNGIDISLASSVIFNVVYNYLNNLLNQTNAEIDLPALNSVTQDNLIEMLQKQTDLCFVDMEIVKQCNFDTDYLVLVDFLLFKGLEVVINSIIENNLGYVDFYKSIKENYALIDKFFACAYNNIFCEVVKLNKIGIKMLINKANGLFNEIKAGIIFSNNEIEQIMLGLKDYTKNCNNLLTYLYLYNIFGV